MVEFIGYVRIDQDYGTIVIGDVNFSQQLVWTRQVKETFYFLLQFAYDMVGYRRVEWICNAFQTKSWQTAIRLGFQYGDTWLKAEVSECQSRDIVHGGVLWKKNYNDG